MAANPAVVVLLAAMLGSLQAAPSSSQAITSNTLKNRQAAAVAPTLGDQAVEVTVNTGRLRGVRRVMPYGGTLDEYRGIPYARPPVGELRFAPPQPPVPWSGVRDATKYGSHCPQAKGSLINNVTTPSEDCLFLNVISSSPHAGAPPAPLLPVMVWVHGGGYYLGAGSGYDASILASQGGVVVVTLNYRLDALGFLSTEDNVIPGNFGMLDQVEALKWVRLNIRQLGGDPGRVTVFGQSAGGHSASLLALSPMARGLLHQIIVQSGSSIAPSTLSRSSYVISPREAAGKLAEKVGCQQSDSRDLLKCLRAQPMEKIQVAGQEVFEENKDDAMLVWMPRVDSATGFMPRDPAQLLSEGWGRGVPSMRGHTSDEMSFSVIDAENDGVTVLEFKQLIRATLKPFGISSQASDRISEKFLNGTNTPLERRYVLSQLISNFQFASPISREIEALTEDNPNVHNAGAASHFLYRFSYRGSLLPTYPAWNGAPHGLDIPFTFGIPEKMRRIWFNGNDPTREDLTTARYLVRMWTNFAKYGHPTPADAPDQLPASWPSFRPDQRVFMNINDSPAVKNLDWREKNEVFHLINTCLFR